MLRWSYDDSDVTRFLIVGRIRERTQGYVNFYDEGYMMGGGVAKMFGYNPHNWPVNVLGTARVIWVCKDEQEAKSVFLSEVL